MWRIGDRDEEMIIKFQRNEEMDIKFGLKNSVDDESNKKNKGFLKDERIWIAI